MSANLASLLVALVGVVGTLGAAVVTQTRADRAKRLELEHTAEQRAAELRHADLLRQAERAEAREHESGILRRQCYVQLNTSGRQYMTALVDHLHALRGGDAAPVTAEELEACREAFRDSYAEAQMIVPAAVLGASSLTSRGLNALYGRLKRTERSTGDPGAEIAAAESELDEVWACLRGLRSEMRKDLGVDLPGHRPA
ncbi:hypothetical protein GXW82_17035 [Streptacidiphilus sp. 4-A2]|nr:hypothetical protein [Streptacidiphilus sp. 4-A2]